MTDEPQDITGLLHKLPDDPEAIESVITSVYDELRSIAAARLRGERVDHSLEATSLVNEACLRLMGGAPQRFEGRSHFFGAVAVAMQRVLIDHARSRGRLKRGGGRVRLPLDVVDLAVEADVEDVVALEDALKALEAEDPQAHGVVRLRFFVGLSVEQAAEALGISPRTAARDWTYARARLVELLEDSGPS